MADTLTDAEIRIRCIEAASRAMAGAKQPQEPSQAFAGNVLGLANEFYRLASAQVDKAGYDHLADNKSLQERPLHIAHWIYEGIISSVIEHMENIHLMVPCCGINPLVC